jgi:hypothetical protein
METTYGTYQKTIFRMRTAMGKSRPGKTRRTLYAFTISTRHPVSPRREAGEWARPLVPAGAAGLPRATTPAIAIHRQIETPPTPAPVALRIFQRKGDADRAARIANQERLRRLKAEHGNEIDIFNSHDPVDYGRRDCN